MQTTIHRRAERLLAKYLPGKKFVVRTDRCYDRATVVLAISTSDITFPKYSSTHVYRSHHSYSDAEFYTKIIAPLVDTLDKGVVSAMHHILSYGNVDDIFSCECSNCKHTVARSRIELARSDYLHLEYADTGSVNPVPIKAITTCPLCKSPYGLHFKIS